MGYERPEPLLHALGLNPEERVPVLGGTAARLLAL
jgi:hypothetical protein